jgi:antitoxin component of MazEF toxin-antitoxin module
MPNVQRFRATLVGTPRGGGGHMVEVPADVIRALGGRGRIPVNATFDGIPYRGSIVRMGGVSVLGVPKSIIEQLGIDVGDAIDVTVEADIQERTVQVPAELAAAIRIQPTVAEAWRGLSFTARKELARSIEEAKKPETRARRVEKAVETLRGRTPSG